MPYARSKSQGISMGLVILLVGLLVPTVAVGAIGTLWAFGQIDLPFLSRGNRIPEGYVRVLVSARKIPAYSKITREDVFDAKIGDFASIPVPRTTVTSDVLTDYGQIRGRVINHEKPAGYVFKEEDFYPKGTRAGLAAQFHPESGPCCSRCRRSREFTASKWAITSTWSRRFRSKCRKAEGWESSTADFRPKRRWHRCRSWRTCAVLAQDAVLLTPVTARQKPTVSKSISQGTTVRNIPVEEVVIAVDPDEVAPVTQALATEVNVMCVVRSGQPGDPEAAHRHARFGSVGRHRRDRHDLRGQREWAVLPMQQGSGFNRHLSHPHSHRGPSHDLDARNTP